MINNSGAKKYKTNFKKLFFKKMRATIYGKYWNWRWYPNKTGPIINDNNLDNKIKARKLAALHNSAVLKLDFFLFMTIGNYSLG